MDYSLLLVVETVENNNDKHQIIENSNGNISIQSESILIDQLIQQTIAKNVISSDAKPINDSCVNRN